MIQRFNKTIVAMNNQFHTDHSGHDSAGSALVSTVKGSVAQQK